MNCKLKLVYFSATDSTKNILHKISESMNMPIDEEFNLTNYEYKDFKHTFENAKTYGKYHILPIKPKGNKKCNKCGLCTKLCPENAIEINDPRKTCRNKCICCMRCVKYCPQKARDLTKTEYLIGELFLKIMRKTIFKKEKEAEIIV